MGTPAGKVVVLLSGGIDSTAVLAYHKEHDDAAVAALFFDYGQPARLSEWRAARAISRHYRVPLRRLNLSLRMARRRGEYLGRNALMVLTAAALGWGPRVLSLGLHEGPYYDSTAAFLADLQRVIDGYTAGTIRLLAPFSAASKDDIIEWAKAHAVPLHRTYSCLRQETFPCRRCTSCLERASLDGA